MKLHLYTFGYSNFKNIVYWVQTIMNYGNNLKYFNVGIKMQKRDNLILQEDSRHKFIDYGFFINIT